MERTFTITEPRRTALAVLLCTVSGFFGAVALQKGATPTSVTFWMWFVWGQTADWVDCRHWLFHRAGRVMWHKTMGQIYEAAKEGQLPLTGRKSSATTRSSPRRSSTGSYITPKPASLKAKATEPEITLQTLDQGRCERCGSIPARPSGRDQRPVHHRRLGIGGCVRHHVYLRAHLEGRVCVPVNTHRLFRES
jgi:hypothetical protein